MQQDRHARSVFLVFLPPFPYSVHSANLITSITDLSIIILESRFCCCCSAEDRPVQTFDFRPMLRPRPRPRLRHRSQQRCSGLSTEFFSRYRCFPSVRLIVDSALPRLRSPMRTGRVDRCREYSMSVLRAEETRPVHSEWGEATRIREPMNSWLEINGNQRFQTEIQDVILSDIDERSPCS